MTIYTWVGGASGSWNDPSNWNPANGFPNGSSDGAVIPGGTTVTISGASYTLADLQLAASATLAVTAGGSLVLYPPGATSDPYVWAGTISIDAASTLEFLQPWTTSQLGPILAASGATLFFANGLDNTGETLNLSPGVSLRGAVKGGAIAGAINIAANAFVTLSDDPTLTGPGGSGAGVINDTANGSTLQLQDTQTIAGATINIGNATNTDFLNTYDSDGLGHVVTLGPGVTVNVSGFAYFDGSADAGDALANKGAIDVTGAGGYLTITNATFNNEGTISVANGDTLIFDGADKLTNTGKISVDSTSFVQFQGLTTAQLGELDAMTTTTSGVTSGATVDFAGSGLDNTGADFKAVFGVNYEGEITGGTIDGALSIYYYQTLTLAGSPILTSGFIDAANSGATIGFDGTQTLDNFTLLLGNTYVRALTADTVTTLGPNVTTDILGNTTFEGAANAGLVNQGVFDDSLNESYPAMYSIAFTNEGKMNFTNHDGFVVDTSVTFTNAASGTIHVAAGQNGASYLLFQDSIENDGTIIVDGFGAIASEIDFYYAATGSGVVEMTNGGLADFLQSMTQHAVFTGAGKLQLNANVNTGAVSSFGSGDSIDLLSLQWAGTSDTWSLDPATDKLTVTEGGFSDTVQLDPSGNYTGYVFTLADDRSGLSGGDGTIVTVVPCFCRGARIATARGEVAVEDLRVGDLALTAAGALRPIRWIGRRALDTARHPSPGDVHPVCVRKDAFGEGLPHRDLWLSPDHCIACDGALAPARVLLNGVSVQQIEGRNVEYWHVELDAHDIMLAEGLPVESYLDSGNRAGFDNGGAFVEVHPDFRPRHLAAACLPLAEQGRQVARARARLSERLQAQGYTLTREAEPFLEADGERVAPIRLSPTRIAFLAPEGARALRLVSDVFAPLHTMESNSDARQLGLSVRRLQIDGADLALDRDEGLGEGWRRAESEKGAFTHRWTSGAAELPAEARLVVVDLAGHGLYWRQPKAAPVAQYG